MHDGAELAACKQGCNGKVVICRRSFARIACRRMDCVRAHRAQLCCKPAPLCRYNVAVMMDTEGSEAHLLALDPVRLEVRIGLHLRHSTTVQACTTSGIEPHARAPKCPNTAHEQ